MEIVASPDFRAFSFCSERFSTKKNHLLAFYWSDSMQFIGKSLFFLMIEWRIVLNAV